MSRTGLLTAGAILAVAVAAAPRPSGAGPEVWQRPPAKSTLENGIPLIYHQDKVSPITVVGLFVPGGRAAVPEGLDGLAYIATRLTLEIPDQDKAQDLMSQATRMSYACEEDGSIVFIECLSENLEAALKVAGKIIQDPLISGLRIGRSKELMELLAKAQQDDAVVSASAAALRAFFGGRAYGSSDYGSAASRKAIGRKHVVEFFRNHFTAGAVFFTVVSDLDQAIVRDLLDKNFSRFPDGGPPEVPSPLPSSPESGGVHLTKETKQTFVGRAYALPAPTADGHAKGCLLEVLIGKGPGSRLWGLRMDERLAYNVGSHVTWTRSAGILEAFLETENAKTDRAAQSLDRALETLWVDGVSEAELEATKAMTKAEFLRSIETKPERVRRLGRFEVLGLGFGQVVGFDDSIEAVDREAFNAYIKTVLAPDKALRVTVGPGTAGDPKGG
jgi:zinc protease